MDVVLGITAPIFLLILLGFLGVRFQLLPKEALPALSRFVLYFALPAVMVTKISAMDMGVLLNGAYLSVYAIGGLTTFFITVVLAQYVFKADKVAASVTGIGAMMPNSSFIGFPILLQFLEGHVAQAFAMSLMVENIVFLPIALVFTEMMANQKSGLGKQMMIKVAKRIVTNPIILSVFVGVMMSATGVHFPEFVSKGLGLLSQGAAPTALFVIGGSLVGVAIQGSKLRIGLVAVMKLVCFPVVVFLCLGLFPSMSYDLRVAVVVFAAMPMFSIYPIIGGEYGQRSFCASSLLATTVCSFVTISLLLKWVA